MQEINRTLSNFLARTELLAEKTTGNISDLPPLLGMSKSMFFGYRSGKNPLSIKAWRKLEAAETIAGIHHPSSRRLRDEHSPQIAESDKSSIKSEKVTVEELAAKVELLTRMVERLLDQRAISSKGHGQAVETSRKKIS